MARHHRTRRVLPPSPLPETFSERPASNRPVYREPVLRTEPIRLSHRLAFFEEGSPLATLLDRTPAESLPEIRSLSRVLLPGVRRTAPGPIRARVDVLRSLLRPIITPRVERATRICVARKTRRQVLFARGKSGRNGSGKPYRRTATSSYSCA